MKVKKKFNHFIFAILVGTCCKNLMTCIFLKTYQIRVIFHKNQVYVTKLKFIWRNEKNRPKKRKGMFLCERLNLYQLDMQTTFFTNVSHLKMQNENYVFVSKQKNTIKIHC